ncbi:hypothetical protein ACU686_25645 [Yinghuangia aomiensis]
MVDSVRALSGRFVDLTAALLQGREAQPSSGQPGGLRDRFSRAMTGAGLKVDVAAGMRDLVLRGTALGPQGPWIVAAANSSAGDGSRSSTATTTRCSATSAVRSRPGYSPTAWR